VRPSRAIWLTVLLLVAESALWGFWLEPASLWVRDVDVPLAWPSSRPLRLLVMSDLHVGSPYHGVRRLRSTVALANATQPDLICVLGDFVTRGVIGGSFVPPEVIAAELRRLQAPGGVVAVLGNHDRWYDGPQVQRALVSAGIRVVEDTAVRLTTPSGPVWIAGVSDLLTASHDVPRALRAVSDRQTPILLLTHNPDIFPLVPDRVTLTLAGHTHGGQVRLPLLGSPVMMTSRYGQRYAAGLVVEEGRRLFVSTGIGTTRVPVRYGVPPSIFVLTLRRAEQ
jgi:predicted MPP superfamily phosphohydrolase